VAFDWVELPTLPEAEFSAVPVRWLYSAGTLLRCSSVLAKRQRGAVAYFNPDDLQRLELDVGTVVDATVAGRAFELISTVSDSVPNGVVLIPGHLPAGPLTVTLKPAVPAPS
jgi:hypothetical protein